MQKALRGANEHFYSKSRSSRNKIVCDHVSLCNSKQLYPLLSNLITWKPPRHALFFSTKSLILRMIITFCDPNLNMIFLWKIKIFRSLLYLNRSEGSNFVNFFFMKNKLQDNIYFLTVLIDKKVISFYQILKRWNVQIFSFYLRWYYLCKDKIISSDGGIFSWIASISSGTIRKPRNEFIVLIRYQWGNLDPLDHLQVI